MKKTIRISAENNPNGSILKKSSKKRSLTFAGLTPLESSLEEGLASNISFICCLRLGLGRVLDKFDLRVGTGPEVEVTLEIPGKSLPILERGWDTPLLKVGCFNS